MHRFNACIVLTLVGAAVAVSPSARAESKQVFGIHFWDWGANIDVMSNRTGWVVEANVTVNDSVDVNRHKWASGEGFTVLQRLDWKWDQTIPLTTVEQDQFAAQCGNWANSIKRYTRHYSIGNEVEFFSVTPSIYATCFQKVRDAIRAVQPDAVVAIGHMNNSQNQYSVMQLLGPDGYDGVTAHTTWVPEGLFGYLDQAGARPEVGVYITEWGWVIGTNSGAMGVMAGFAQDIGQWNATHERQVYCACWYIYPDFLPDSGTFSLELSPIDNAAFENATALGQAMSRLQDNPIIISDLVAEVPDAGDSIALSWTTNVPARRQLWWTEDGTWSWDHEKFTDRTTAAFTSHQHTIIGLAPGTTYEVMPNCTANDYADAGGRRFHVTTGPWSSTVTQIPDAVLTVRVSWHTDWASDSRVEYGPTPALGAQAVDSAIVTDHLVTIQGIAPGDYYYRIVSAEPEMDPQTGRMQVRSPIRTFTVAPQAPGDYDGDGDVDGDDAQQFEACYSGPVGPGFTPPSQTCQDAFDADGDTDVDCEDYVGFALVWTGPPLCPPAFTTCESDCNGDGVRDACEIARGLKQDCDDNGQPDDCQPDDDGDGVPDLCDLCPDTIPGTYVDSEGCPAFLKADLDRDGDVDQDDFGQFQLCYTVSGVSVTDPACMKAKLDADEDVDASDFDLFYACMSGPNVPIDPSCEQ